MLSAKQFKQYYLLERDRHPYKRLKLIVKILLTVDHHYGCIHKYRKIYKIRLYTQTQKFVKCFDYLQSHDKFLILLISIIAVGLNANTQIRRLGFQSWVQMSTIEQKGVYISKIRYKRNKLETTRFGSVVVGMVFMPLYIQHEFEYVDIVFRLTANSCIVFQFVIILCHNFTNTNNNTIVEDD